MAWEDTLIQLYLYISQQHRHDLAAYAHRFSNNDAPTFTDQGVLTIYLFGLIKQHKTLKAIYDYARDHLADYFPQLPSYGGYVQRLNRLSDVFPVLIENVLEACPHEGVIENVRLIDSMPIIMAGQQRASRAKVAPDFANKGYCASKQMYYYGVKLHVLGLRREGTMPLPEQVGLTPGSENDLVALRPILPHLSDTELYADKAYLDAQMAKKLVQEQNVGISTPIKKKKGQGELTMTDRAFSQAVSRVRQPIESLFNWIEEETGIQCASKVRSHQGLLVHVFGRFAAAMYLLVFNP